MEGRAEGDEQDRSVSLRAHARLMRVLSVRPREANLRRQPRVMYFLSQLESHFYLTSSLKITVGKSLSFLSY